MSPNLLLMGELTQVTISISFLSYFEVLHSSPQILIYFYTTLPTLVTSPQLLCSFFLWEPPLWGEDQNFLTRYPSFQGPKDTDVFKLISVLHQGSLAFSLPHQLTPRSMLPLNLPYCILTTGFCLSSMLSPLSYSLM